MEVLRPAGRTRIWLPTPLTIKTPYQKPLGGNILTGEGGTTSTMKDPESANAIACFAFPEGVKPVAVLRCRAMTRDYSVDFAHPQPRKSMARPESKDVLERFLKPTALMPTDGIVKETATKITRSAREDIDKARAIYDWVVENTYRDPKVQGCGRRRHPRDARIEDVRREVRRAERALRRSLARVRSPGSSCVWPARREVQSRLQEPRSGHRDRHERHNTAARKCI